MSGQTAPDPAIALMKSRRRIACPKAQDHADIGLITSGIGDERNGVRRPFAQQQFVESDVRFGSKADIARCQIDVRFTPKSGHSISVSECPLCAKSGHNIISVLLEICLDSRFIFQYLLKYEKAPSPSGFGRARAGQSS
jgi:hypothetical protein